MLLSNRVINVYIYKKSINNSGNHVCFEKIFDYLGKRIVEDTNGKVKLIKRRTYGNINFTIFYPKVF